ncbi:MAG TPA: YhjD/YihY/BrkB family envelope integrity protein, partial [Thermoanaerobaculia bacterium]|nr:YhjD/YihY/BrkB family envelope integrity protein [Thermoanaerobaculia bacterium]
MRRGFFRVIRRTFSEWHKDMAQRLAAAVAFYTLFSLAPLLLLCLAVASHVYGARAARGELMGTLRELVGQDVAAATQVIIANAAHSEAKFSATLLGAVLLFFAASGVFTQLQSALNTIWHVPTRSRGIVRGFFTARLFAVLMVFLVISFIMTSLLITAALSHLQKYPWLRSRALSGFWQAVNFTLFSLLLTVMFAMMFRFL